MALEFLSCDGELECNENFSRVKAVLDPISSATETFFEALKCTVTFDSDGGSEVPAQELIMGQKAAEPDDPEKAGFTFSGWINADEEAFDFDTRIKDDITLSASWTADETE